MAQRRHGGSKGRALEMGVDIGGTFTDVVLFRHSGETRTAKVLTTQSDPERGVLDGIRKVLRDEGASCAEVGRLIHATTLATNAIVERKGRRTAMVTTRGFRDVIETRNELRYDLYDLDIELPPALIPRSLRLPVTERTAYDGKVLHAVDLEEVDRIAEQLAEEQVESVAICLLHSYANPENEQAVAGRLRQRLQGVGLSLSADVLPEIGEYGRFSTTAINAYVQPLVARYLTQLAEALAKDGFGGTFTIMASSGGTLPLATAQRFPVRLVESGPAAGAHAAAVASVALGIEQMLSLDIGGTTAKMCVIQKGTPSWTTDFEVARLSRFKKGSGLALKVPTVDLIEIGAGGGSIARVNSLGLIEVGPDSAGADPGPACYALDGISATVTDADLLLGYLNPANFLGGDMRLDLAAAEKAVLDAVGRPLRMDAVQAAWSINSIVNENMANAARVYTAERGIDIRSFTLYAFGGAGPVHACGLAQRLGIRDVIVPMAGGVLSAVGCVLAPMTFDLVRGFKGGLDTVDFERANGLLKGMIDEATTLLRRAGFERGIVVEPSADMRFSGQRSDVNVPFRWSRLTSAVLPALDRRFRELYRARYGRDVPEVKPELVNLRVSVRGPARRGVAGAHVSRPSARTLVPRSMRPMVFEGGRTPATCPAYDRAALATGQRIAGGAVIEDRDSTIVVPPRWTATADPHGNLLLTRRG